MTETTWKWAIGAAIIAAIFAVIVASRLLSERAERLRRAWFEGLAAALRAKAVHESKWRSRCTVTTLDRRVFEVLHTYRGGGGETQGGPGWSLRAVTRLQGVSDIYNIRFGRSFGGKIEANMHGYVPRDGWQTPALMQALDQLFAASSRYDNLDVEGGSLIFRSPRRLDGESLRTIVSKQATAARELEQAL